MIFWKGFLSEDLDSIHGTNIRDRK